MNNSKDINGLTPEERIAINEKITRFGAILIALGIIAFCFALAKLENGFSRVFVMIIAGILGVVGIFTISVAVSDSRAIKNKRNFFLYDRKKKRNVELSELKIESVREKIGEFLAAFKIKGKLFIGDIFDERNRIPEHFKILFCYELLCQIAEHKSNSKVFLALGNECAAVFEKYLLITGDGELSAAIRSHFLKFSSGEDNSEEFAEFIKSKEEHIKEKMLDYVKENISKFG